MKCYAYHPTKQMICRYDEEDHPVVHKDWEGSDFDADQLADAMGVLMVEKEARLEMAEVPDMPGTERRDAQLEIIHRLRAIQEAFWAKWGRVY